MGRDEVNDYGAECGYVMILPERVDFQMQELPVWFCWLADRRGGGLGEPEERHSPSGGGTRATDSRRARPGS